MAAAWYWWRATRGRSWRAVLTVALIGGLLGTVALGGLAGARRTASAYGRYLASINASDVFVDIPGPFLPPIPRIAALPGVRESAAWVGLAAYPVIHGRVDDSFRANNLVGSFNGELFRQDRMTVLAGRLPRLGSMSEIALTPATARQFGVGVGGKVTWQFYGIRQPSGTPYPAGRSTFVVTGIVVIPPVLTDQFDDVPNAAVLPPAATARYLRGEFQYAWVGLRLTAGAAGIPALQSEIDRPGAEPGPALHNSQRSSASAAWTLCTTRSSRRSGRRPSRSRCSAALAALAMLVLVGQGLAQLLSRSAGGDRRPAGDGATRGQAALAAGLEGGGRGVGRCGPGCRRRLRGLAAGPGRAGAPVRPGPRLRRRPAGAGRRRRGPGPRPARRARGAGLAGGPPGRAEACGATVSDCRRGRRGRPAGRGGDRGTPRARARIGAAARGSPCLPGRVGRGSDRRGHGRGIRRQPERLVSHPARYGWNWDLLIEAEGGYGNWKPAVMDQLVDHQPGVTGWSQFGFSQVAY